MTTDDIRKTITDYISEQLLVGEPEPVGADDELLIDGIIDSLGVTRLTGFISSEFAIEVPAEDVTVENFRTINLLSSYVGSRTGNGTDSDER